MCTLTLRRSGRGYLLTMNRDERLERAPEEPPGLHEQGRVRWAGPLDGAGRGSWIGLNEFGVTAALLNRYPDLEGDTEPEPPSSENTASRPSRGRIIPLLLGQGRGRQVLNWLGGPFDPSPYDRFTLLVAWPGGARLFLWKGAGTLVAREAAKPWEWLSSSSWRQPEVLEWRRRLFDEWLATGEAFRGPLPTYHLHQTSGYEAWSPLMRRDYAATRSITQVEVLPDTTRGILRYWPQPDPALPVDGEQLLDMPLEATLPPWREG